MKYILLFSALLLFAGEGRADMFRSVDSSGRVYYSDRPAPDSTELRFGKNLPQKNLPYETRTAMKKNPVTLYVADGCGESCAEARRLLKTRGIPHEEKNLAGSEEIEAFKKASGSDIVPVLAIGKNWLKGFQTEAWQQGLDTAGYSKTAPYGTQTP